MKRSILWLMLFPFSLHPSAGQALLWMKHEIGFSSDTVYENPLYEVKDFRVLFTAPSGKTRVVRGFWDGGQDWKVRYCPDETGEWSWKSRCSDEKNPGLHNRQGTFSCRSNGRSELIFQKGSVRHPPGKYYLAYSDGTPFFWLACTAWNGALRSTEEEWQYYLDHRVKNHYRVIQLVTTEWRGGDKNAEGLTAIEGTGRIRIHPEFFRRLDRRIDQANQKGLIVSPVLLWALPFGQGRHLSPGYTLPLDEAVLLARYIVARYQGNQVIWTLGGDGKYYDDQELKWKEIGRRVFNDIDHAPVTLHPHGISWLGELYAAEDWYDLMGYQSSHSNGEKTVNWINKGPMSRMWSRLKPMPYINMEPNYEQIGFKITARDVRNAAYWSLFATPVAGITYGANGIWPWLRDGESILNHSDAPGTTNWRASMDFPGSIQMGYLARMFERLEWWKFYPANELLVHQPGDAVFNHWISVLQKEDRSEILVYVPMRETVRLFNPTGSNYRAQWFDPATNEFSPARVASLPAPEMHHGSQMEIRQDQEKDMLLLLQRDK